jgi:hypothetical protein
MNTMRFFALMSVVLSISGALLVADAGAQTGNRHRYTAAQRAKIRATPILERPSRPLHFYGNTVRRNAQKSKSTALAKRAPSPQLKTDIGTARDSQAEIAGTPEKTTPHKRNSDRVASFPNDRSAATSAAAPSAPSLSAIKNQVKTVSVKTNRTFFTLGHSDKSTKKAD